MGPGFCSGHLLPSNLLVDRIPSAQTCWLVTNISVFYFGVWKNFKEHMKRRNSKLKELAPDFPLFQTSTTIHTAATDSKLQNLCLMQREQKVSVWETCKEQEIGHMVADHRSSFRVAWISLTEVQALGASHAALWISSQLQFWQRLKPIWWQGKQLKTYNIYLGQREIPHWFSSYLILHLSSKSSLGDLFR